MKKLIIYNGFFRLLIPPLTGIVIYLLILLLNNEVSNLSDIFIGQEVYVCIGMAYLVLEALRLFSFTFEKFINNILLFIITSTLIGVAITTISVSAYFNYVLEFSIADNQLLIFNTTFGFFSLLYNLLFVSQIYLHKQNKNRLLEERLLTETLESEFNQFKNEVNPDLLYDSLETLITLAHKNVEETEDYIDQLSLVYRYILSHRKVEFVTIEADLKAANSIVYLLQSKHQNAISITEELDENIKETLIIPGTLPNLIENIIRSTIISSDSPLAIKILFDREEKYLVVEHKTNERLNQSQSNFKRSLEESYTIYSDKPVIEIIAYGINYFKIPLLEVEINVSSEKETIEE
ncbi:histidine kinase [Fulvivirga lutea]|uniref:Histidine kinase n=1 Tax=Fulvivirga lutea TaxID=2810512 RepID=A0A974WH34_9BACT|nr:histidine kinase [Fulvivirga lutea]QSE95975.1 histidine kinase [Fulvivirga lutea]